MPNTHDTLASLFSDIADAIREKDGTSENIVADTFPDRIAAIPVSTKTKFYIEAIENTTIKLVKIGSPTTGTCTYGIDDESTPTSYTYGNNISLNAGEKCYFSITSSSVAFSSSNYLNFTSTGNINAGGNISSLIGGDLTIPRNYCFYRLFYNCTKLISIQDLVLDPTTLRRNCYSHMFRGCTSLASLPSNLLPVTKLATFCYLSMFYGCTSLTNVPNLPATKLVSNCYDSMFYGCTSLTNVPNLPATTLANYCYQSMFENCTSLTTLSNNLLPATTLKIFCYQSMFRDCTSLTNVPNLPATTLEDFCYNDMFYGCSKIKLSETQSGNYQNSFRIPASGSGTSGNKSLTNMFSHTGGTFTGTPDINTTYYLWEYVNVDVSDTTATASDVLTGRYFYTSNGTKTEGSLANGSATTPATSINLGSGTGSVASSTGIVTITSAEATQSVTPTVVEGYISSGIAGTITVPSKSFTYQLPTTKAAATITPGTTNQTIAAGTYLTGTQTIVGDADLVASNIKQGATIFGVEGSYSGTDTSDANAVASDIVSGKTAYVNGIKITGTIIDGDDLDY